MSLFSSRSLLAGAGHRLVVASVFLAVTGPAHAEITASDPGAETHGTAIERRNKAIVHDAFEKQQTSEPSQRPIRLPQPTATVDP
ncbi:hypothetical protein HDIA_1723 [Hartmannibacter diazotrophicus]|uniref:Uncharacterized protein n=1 Tax=Hartmannibacter diazotrophicus TaxID=1482074 RepID=A0A2C9D4N9_9HYPH|nr:hypothetical protein HDIA_1723 [Hartmannibacter diazotrophicus]